MGMTIEESKRNLSYAIQWKDRPTDESMMLAIDTMRKYQKIAQIYQKWNEVNDFSYNQAMSQIGEVLEDEN